MLLLQEANKKSRFHPINARNIKNCEYDLSLYTEASHKAQSETVIQYIKKVYGLS